MSPRLRSLLPGLAILMAVFHCSAALKPAGLRTEWLENPVGVGAAQPRLSWRVESDQRAQRQTAWQVLVAGDASLAFEGKADLWDSGRVEGGETLGIPYGGRPLRSGQTCHWRVKVWDASGRESGWSPVSQWTCALLQPADWKAKWIAFHDTSPLPTNAAPLHLPPPRHYRREFQAGRPVRKALLHFSALGLAEFHINGERVGDAWFEPGWSDYARRAYTRTHDVTKQVRRGDNCLGAVVAEGWYAGYVGYGLLVGYGPSRTGRNLYGRTPALLAQLDIEYEDGGRETVATDETWWVTEAGPVREADMLMGEMHDARLEMPGWSRPGFQNPGWQHAVSAASNGAVPAVFHESGGSRPVDLGFREPAVLQPYAAPPIRVTQQVYPRRMTEPRPGVYVFDLGQNIAGVVRLKVQAPAGTRVQIRHAEMLHEDGTLMTENLRRARATDVYICRGGGVETWHPRFTYHGFQYVELTGLAMRPGLDAVTGLVIHNDNPAAGEFTCSDPVMTRFARNTYWTQRANFVEVPTDCPQRDERLGWMGDAQLYARTAASFADVAAFFTKWIDDVREAQRESGAYPDYAPYPMAHGAPGATHGAAWTDAGVMVSHVMWQVYGDSGLITRHWDSMVRFMDWRRRSDPELKGVTVGNTWGDWLNVNEETPIPFIDLCYHAHSARLMAEMARGMERGAGAGVYQQTFEAARRSFQSQYLRPDGTLAVDTQTAYVLALWTGMVPESLAVRSAQALADKIATNGFRMSTGLLGTKPLLGVLTRHGQHELALRLFQSRRFPSWGYEVEQGATTVWERWDSFTREHGFEGFSGRNNAAMNSFSHYAFGAVMEWAFRDLAGIDTEGPGFRKLSMRPGPPSVSHGEARPLDWVKASYEHPRGSILSDWRVRNGRFEWVVRLPANTTAVLQVPAEPGSEVLEGIRPADKAEGVRALGREGRRALYEVGSGVYRFTSHLSPLRQEPR